MVRRAHHERRKKISNPVRPELVEGYELKKIFTPRIS